MIYFTVYKLMEELISTKNNTEISLKNDNQPLKYHKRQMYDDHLVNKSRPSPLIFMRCKNLQSFSLKILGKY